MKRLVYTLAILTITIGIVGFSLNRLFGQNTVVYLRVVNVNGIMMYKYDFWAYIQNIYNQFTDTPELVLTIPTDTWANTGNWLADAGNNMAYMLNRFLMAINICMYPFRLFFYGVQIILTIVGIPTMNGTYEENPLKWLIETCKFCTNLQIPYVQN